MDDYEDFADSQESFSDFFRTQYDQNLFPELGSCTAEEVNDFEEEIVQSLIEPSTSNYVVANTNSINLLNDTNLTENGPIISTGNSEESRKNNDFNSNCSDSFGLFINFTDFCENNRRCNKFTYSAKLNKLFVQMNEICPLQFSCENSLTQNNYIKVFPCFKKPQDFLEAVKPCLLHQKPSKDLTSTNHLIQAPNQNATNIVTENGQYAVRIPLNEVNGKLFTVLLKFACLSSCKTGINKRPIELVFLLETSDGDILGRCSLDICICTRPDRDCENHEKKQDSKSYKKPLKRSHSSLHNFLDSSSNDEADDDQIYYMIIKGKQTYKRLLAVKQAFDLEKLVSDSQRKEYFRKESLYGNN